MRELVEHTRAYKEKVAPGQVRELERRVALLEKKVDVLSRLVDFMWSGRPCWKPKTNSRGPHSSGTKE